jgi:hypothetical protein
VIRQMSEIFYFKGRCLRKDGIFNAEEGEWADPKPDTIDEKRKLTHPAVKAQVYPKTMMYNDAHHCWNHKGEEFA